MAASLKRYTSLLGELPPGLYFGMVEYGQAQLNDKLLLMSPLAVNRLFVVHEPSQVFLRYGISAAVMAAGVGILAFHLSWKRWGQSK